MPSLAHTFYLTSRCGVVQSLPHAGSVLENPFVYDAVAKDIKSLAAQGLVEILDERVSERASETLVEELSFRRLR